MSYAVITRYSDMKVLAAVRCRARVAECTESGDVRELSSMFNYLVW